MAAARAAAPATAPVCADSPAGPCGKLPLLSGARILNSVLGGDQGRSWTGDHANARRAMTRKELHATGALAAVFATRLLGLFMIYPVFAAYARHLEGATAEMIGLALGAYGLTQGLLQIRIGRKVVIAGGLVLFGVGSAVAALSGSIEGVLIGRILQGMGAVGSVVLALVADLTREEVRTRAMAIVGVTIGLAFVVAIAVGPLLAAVIGVPGIFWLTAALALFGIAVTLLLVPTPPRVVRHRDAEAVPALLLRVLRDRELLRLDFAIFSLHAILTASFLAVPALLGRALHLGSAAEWKLYLPVQGAAEQRRHRKKAR